MTKKKLFICQNEGHFATQKLSLLLVTTEHFCIYDIKM